MVVKQQEAKLDHVFHALADPTRRKIIRLIAAHPCTISELSKPFPISLAAISKHIKVLEKAGLVNRHVKGRIHSCSIQLEGLSVAREWLRFYEDLWNSQFDKLEIELNNDEC
ncbi:MAG: ArsR/SmtB family transcription factor [Bacillota bacterium]|uniref:Winged helix-turn-helix transcriptional regulator n=1 Tax=Virgibacillus salarius TaxID=447199 RepID=A0A941DT93_9BACI|nr:MULTISPECIES: metalloregulator ArsR/SmtB family transcription factor [Bacillaceae]NAZ07799.1 metalloregulator ArsR/SmtB family transcription factor [Agaribacter marinus]MBR7795082.1 winged helix-turn-helix transcriptional regulator [Virgibacillus salarius]MCC2248414.1 metalloregulator ArsR/SmtB family transcription factor [Virgibacillus sp. AGTR]MDY7043153.1 metalloregulator ArsR/SmtB family transcription factor [Virgibacillus sp. M23]QRZ16721.1 winged helix-turn-helix transcriptional regul